ncbi:ATP-binding protein [Streptomyces sp. NPDC020800]|uniref:sensor histidine kinase n=1 Tax=Streptomyces sp. NPDC020800 TaxID=3365092 RepID=UPI003795B5D4
MTTSARSRRLWRLANPLSLRWKVTAGVAMAACAMALGMGILVHHTTETRSLSIGRAAAMDDLDSAIQQFRESRAAQTSDVSDPGYEIDDEVPDTLRELLGSSKGPVTWYEVRKSVGQAGMWAAGRDNGTVIAVRHDMISDFLTLQALDRHMRYAALATLAVVVPASVGAAELMLRRLRRVADTATRIRHGDLDARTGAHRHDEIGEISSAVDLMADALQNRLHSEQRFTADVAHELRTPIAGLVTSAALLPESEVTHLICDRAAKLRTLVEDLLEISRLDTGIEQADTQPVPLGELVNECLLRSGAHARLSVTGLPVVNTDPRRLNRVITNLVLNAQRHGAPPIDVTVHGTTIVVRDHGPGFPPELLAQGPQRFRTAAPERGHGHGLGLTIAQAQAQVIGAQLTMANTTPHGAAATLKLPSTPNPPHAERGLRLNFPLDRGHLETGT